MTNMDFLDLIPTEPVGGTFFGGSGVWGIVQNPSKKIWSHLSVYHKESYYSIDVPWFIIQPLKIM